MEQEVKGIVVIDKINRKIIGKCKARDLRAQMQQTKEILTN